MKFKECDTVKVKKDCIKGVNKGDIGTIVIVFDKPREAYEVEFLDEDGHTKAQCVFLPNELELVEIVWETGVGIKYDRGKGKENYKRRRNK